MKNIKSKNVSKYKNIQIWKYKKHTGRKIINVKNVKEYVK